MSSSPQLTVALLQAELAWEDSTSNLLMVESKLKELTSEVDLVILPEMFSTGFTMSPQHIAEANDGITIVTLRQFSKLYDIAICGSFAASENNKYFNRFFWIENGDFRYQYDKRHLFRMANENEVYCEGDSDVAINFKGWNIMPRICYDLRFPVWSRSTNIDLQIYVANWPSMRVAAWDKLLLARAIENQCYVIGVNRIGKDGNDVPYCGHSVVIDPKGYPLTPAQNQQAGWINCMIDLEMLQTFKEKFPVSLDADHFEIMP